MPLKAKVLKLEKSLPQQSHSPVGARSEYSAKNGLINSLNRSKILPPQGTGASISKMVYCDPENNDQDEASKPSSSEG